MSTALQCDECGQVIDPPKRKSIFSVTGALRNVSFADFCSRRCLKDWVEKLDADGKDLP